MNQRIARFAAVGLACAGLGLAACSKKSNDPPPPDYGVTVNPIAGLPADFIKGADVSMLPQLEASGARFYDEAGVEKDALQILKDHGVNWVRLRLWNAPVVTHAFDVGTSSGILHVEPGQYAGGKNDVTRDIALAQRAKALGLKVLLDFHYSDWWADPEKQLIPQAWESYSLEQMVTAVHDFTGQTITAMRDAGAQPDMVQIGNETNQGFLWPVGKTSGPNGYDGFARLLSAAASAIRNVDPGIQIMIHLANGGDNSLYTSMFSNLASRGVDFDVIGLSYYPYWHGSMASFQANANDVSAYFNKPVVVAETAYAWTLEDIDAEKNSFGAKQEDLGGYKATVQGQATFLRNLMAVVAGVPDRRGLGIFYWEPEWILVPGAGWYSGGGDGWDNQTLFDHDGKALASMNVFRAVSGDQAWVEPELVSIPDANVSVPLGTVPTLPSSVGARYSDDSVRSLYVVWDAVAPATWSTKGTFDVTGTVVGTEQRATLHAMVYVNLLTNAGFESDLTGWDVTAPAGVTSAENNAGNAHSGAKSFHWWAASAFTFSVSQTVTGLSATQSYVFSVFVSGKAGSKATAFATCNGATTELPVANTGWADWHEYTLSGLSGAGGSCTVGVKADAAGDDWGNLDDLQFHPSL